jgi:hypothetical protein
MRGNARSTSRKSESGSTLLEAIVALAIISILGVGAWNAVGAAIRISGKINEKTMENARILQLDDALRDLAARIRAPYWVSKHAVAMEAGNARVPYLDGDPDKAFTLSFLDGVITLDDGVRVMRFSGFARAAFSAAENEESGVYGLTMELSTKDGRAVSMTARFGSMPIQKKEAS